MSTRIFSGRRQPARRSSNHRQRMITARIIGATAATARRILKAITGGSCSGCVVRRNSMPSQDLDRTLAALADPTRRSIIDLLRQKPRRPGELADALSLNRPRMSQHLRVLRQSGLVEEDQRLDHDARIRVFRLRPEPLAAVRDWLDEVQEFWSAQLASFKMHAERGRSKRRK